MTRAVLAGAAILALAILLVAALGPTPAVGLGIGAGALAVVNLLGTAACIAAARRFRGAEWAAFWCLSAALALWAFARLAWLVALTDGGSADAQPALEITILGTTLLGAATFVLLYRHYREGDGWDGPLDAGIAALSMVIVMTTLANSGQNTDVDADTYAATLQIGLLVGLVVGVVGMLMWRRSAVHCWLRWGLGGALLLTVQILLSLVAMPPSRHPELRLTSMAIGVLSSACLAVMALRRIELGNRPAATATIVLKPRPLMVRLTPPLTMLCAVAALVWDQGPLGYLAIAVVVFVLARAIGTLRTVESLLDERNRWAVTDPLTGVFNRRHLEHELPILAARAQRANEPLAALIVDLDGFKNVNDSHGHGMGDHLLQRMASAVSKELRAGDSLFRIGGDEFFILAPATEVDAGVALAERVRARVSEAAQEALPEGPPVTASIGVVAVPHAPCTRKVLAEADTALYAAKESGRNRVISADRA